MNHGVLRQGQHCKGGHPICRSCAAKAVAENKDCPCGCGQLSIDSLEKYPQYLQEEIMG
jgi:hypothetical protein